MDVVSLSCSDAGGHRGTQSCLEGDRDLCCRSPNRSQAPMRRRKEEVSWSCQGVNSGWAGLWAVKAAGAGGLLLMGLG